MPIGTRIASSAAPPVRAPLRLESLIPAVCSGELLCDVAAEVAASVESAASYVGASDPRDPRLSPVFAPASSKILARSARTACPHTPPRRWSTTARATHGADPLRSATAP